MNEELEKKRLEAENDLAASSKNFGDVLMRENRYDLLLDLDPPVKAAVDEALKPWLLEVNVDPSLAEKLTYSARHS